ncbi:hypothetical protein GGR56DRAFT_655845 [Xylariaceae sp. FL0804]|nr:hypothetical protein GGR56DRAFT_655845 [Xylariaceae sp. FL0804]
MADRAQEAGSYSSGDACYRYSTYRMPTWCLPPACFTLGTEYHYGVLYPYLLTASRTQYRCRSSSSSSSSGCGWLVLRSHQLPTGPVADNNITLPFTSSHPAPLILCADWLPRKFDGPPKSRFFCILLHRLPILLSGQGLGYGGGGAFSASPSSPSSVLLCLVSAIAPSRSPSISQGMAASYRIVPVFPIDSAVSPHVPTTHSCQNDSSILGGLWCRQLVS